MRLSVNTTLLLYAVACCPYAAAAPGITITLAPEVRSENVSIYYYRFGTFGAAGAPATPLPEVHSYDLDPYYESTLATNIKAVVTAPGCQFETFDIPVTRESPIQEHFECTTLPMTFLVGNIAPSRLTRGRNLEVVITYLAFWECGFFQLVDCMVPEVQLATVPLKADGSFEATITDFSADRYTSERAGSAELSLFLRDAKTWNHIGIGLRPTEDLRSTSVASLAIKPFYPVPVEFEIVESSTNSANSSAETPVAH